MDPNRTTCVSCGKAIFGQPDCPFCKTKQPNKMRRGSTKNQRAFAKGGEQPGLSKFIGTEMGVAPPKPRAASAPASGPVSEEAGEGEARGPASKKPEPNPAAMQMAALMQGAFKKKPSVEEEDPSAPPVAAKLE